MTFTIQMKHTKIQMDLCVRAGVARRHIIGFLLYIYCHMFIAISFISIEHKEQT